MDVLLENNQNPPDHLVYYEGGTNPRHYSISEIIQKAKAGDQKFEHPIDEFISQEVLKTLMKHNRLY